MLACGHTGAGIVVVLEAIFTRAPVAAGSIDARHCVCTTRCVVQALVDICPTSTQLSGIVKPMTWVRLYQQPLATSLIFRQTMLCYSTNLRTFLHSHLQKAFTLKTLLKSTAVHLAYF